MRSKEYETQLKHLETCETKTKTEEQSRCVKCDTNTKTQDQSRCVKVLRCISGFFFSGLAAFWISWIMVTYRSEPISSTVSMIHNKSFTWPTLTIAPDEKCFNTSQVGSLSEMYNLSRTNSSFYKPYYLPIPFDLQKSNFNWSLHNLSDILIRGKYIQRENIIQKCAYLGQLSIRKWECMNETSELGTWRNYMSHYSAYYSFTPIPAVSHRNGIILNINSTICKNVKLLFHPSKDIYRSYGPSARYIYISPNQQVIVTLKAEEYHKVNRKVSPCVEDIDYSQTECYNEKITEYYIKKAGCYLPAISGSWLSNNYSECNNLSTYETFIYWFNSVIYQSDYVQQPELESEKEKCLPCCQTQIYDIVSQPNTNVEVKAYYGNQTVVFIELNSGAFAFQKVEEQFLINLETLVANIGGTLGLFLGFSCFTVIGAIEYMLKRL